MLHAATWNMGFWFQFNDEGHKKAESLTGLANPRKGSVDMYQDIVDQLSLKEAKESYEGPFEGKPITLHLTSRIEAEEVARAFSELGLVYEVDAS